jgi:hypothetical protein
MSKANGSMRQTPEEIIAASVILAWKNTGNCNETDTAGNELIHETAHYRIDTGDPTIRFCYWAMVAHRGATTLWFSGYDLSLVYYAEVGATIHSEQDDWWGRKSSIQKNMFATVLEAKVYCSEAIAHAIAMRYHEDL